MTVAKASLRQGDRQATKGMSTVEAHRRLAVNLVFLIYILMLVEGPLRKWFAPGLATPLYFLRDPVVIFLYAYCLHRSLIGFGGWARTWLTFATVVSLIGLIPFMLESVDGRAWILGVRTYWLYMPLAFVIASTFDRSDLLRFFRWNIVFAIPYALLIIAQYKSPGGAWINAGIGSDEGIAMVALGIVRPYGVFTYAGQNVYFVVSLVSIIIAYVMLSEKSIKSWMLCFLGSVAIASLSVLSGSRAIYFFIGAIVITTLAGTMAAGKGALRANIFVVFGVGLGAFLFVYVFSDAFEAFQVRLDHAGHLHDEKTQQRAFGGLAGWLVAMTDAPLLGHGIGVGTPAISGFLDRPYLQFGESELMRNVYELGVVSGAMFVMLRFAFAAYILIVAFRAARERDTVFLPLAGLVALGFARAPITHSPLNGFTFFMFAGLVLASARMIERKPREDMRHEPLLKKRRVSGSRAIPPSDATAVGLSTK